MSKRKTGPNVLTSLIIAAGLISFGALGSVSVHAQETFSLLNDAELAFRKLLNRSEKTPITRSISILKSGGPRIKVSSPRGFSLRSPVNFDIRIRPRGGVAVKMSTLKIEYKLGGFWANVTNRITRRAKIRGTTLRARGVKLPTGKHIVRLSIMDVRGRRTSALVTFSVR